MSGLPASAGRVVAALRARGFSNEVVVMPASTRTSAEAAGAVGCTVAQIAKSLIFRGKRPGEPLLAVASGGNRVDQKKLRDLTGERPGRADADWVREVTGFAIGGVPPLGHTRLVRTFIDRDLMGFDEIWAAAGTPNAVFRLTPAELVAMTDGIVGDLREE